MKPMLSALVLAAALLPCAHAVAGTPVLRLDVDATDVERGLFSAREQIPVQGGKTIRLRYPAWIPGAHAPIGAIANLTGLTFTAQGQPVAWKRDPLDVYALLVTPPAGATVLEARMIFVSPLKPEQGRVIASPDMLRMGWHQLSLYPAGRPVRDIEVAASLRVPDGWRVATALDAAPDAADGVTHYRPVSYETLVDSPVLAGRYVRRDDLGSGVTLNIAADSPEALKASDAQIGLHRALVTQAQRLFGTRHFDHYDFLVTLSDTLGGLGLEHHRSSEDGVGTGYFTRPDEAPSSKNLLPHELVHSWNGKFRRPRGLATPDYATPMDGSLLWVYEGQTQFWGTVLEARSGLGSQQLVRDYLAVTAATYDLRAGRAWRPLADTAHDPVMADRRPGPWPSWQRAEDYYREGMLLWLDADMLIRAGTNGARSLDDVARRFFGGRDGDWSVSPYTRADVVAALGAVYPHDWEGFLAARLDALAPHPPLDWIAQGGYRLVYTQEPGDYIKADEKTTKSANFSYSLGLTLRTDGEIAQVLWDSPAFAAKLIPGSTILAVNGTVYSAEVLKAALNAKGRLDLTVRRKDRLSMVALDYHDGQRYPHLERIADTPARLDDLLAPLAATSPIGSRP